MKSWSVTETRELIRLCGLRLPCAQIAARLGRSRWGVQHKTQRLARAGEIVTRRRRGGCTHLSDSTRAKLSTLAAERLAADLGIPVDEVATYRWLLRSKNLRQVEAVAVIKASH